VDLSKRSEEVETEHSEAIVGHRRYTTQHP
jgi:hypothetical protein